MKLTTVSILLLLAVALGVATNCFDNTPRGHPDEHRCYHLALQKEPGSDDWTLHGLWPDMCTPGVCWPQFCDKIIGQPRTFQGNFDPDTQARMDEHWPSNKLNNQVFWTHEWEKHGVCTSMAENDYFKFTLDTLQNIVNQGYLNNCHRNAAAVYLDRVGTVVDVICGRGDLNRNLFPTLPYPTPLTETPDAPATDVDNSNDTNNNNADTRDEL